MIFIASFVRALIVSVIGTVTWMGVTAIVGNADLLPPMNALTLFCGTMIGAMAMQPWSDRGGI